MVRRRPEKVSKLMDVVHECMQTGSYQMSLHALQRRRQRCITLPELEYVLINGRHEKSKDTFDEPHQSWNYAIRGTTLDAVDMRIIVSFDEESCMVVITAFYIANQEKK